MQVVDAAAPVAHRLDRVPLAEQQVAGVEAEAYAGQLQHLLDLPDRFDVRAGLVVEGGLVSSLTAASGGRPHAVGEALPGLGVEAQAPVVGGLTRPCPASLAACVGT